MILPRLGGYSASELEVMRTDQILRRAEHVMDVNKRLKPR